MEKATTYPCDENGLRQVTYNGPTLRETRAGTTALMFLLILVALVWPGRLSAQDSPSVARPADTSSPRATLKSFIDACNELHGLINAERFYDRTSPVHRPVAYRILDCFDISDLPEYERAEAAGEIACCLKEILDRVELPPYDQIPDEEAIRKAGGPEKLSRWKIPGVRITIARVEEGPQRHEYLFTPGTLERAVEYFEEVKNLPYRTTGPAVSEGLYRWYISAPGHPAIARTIDRLPDWARERVAGMAMWKWVGLLVLLLVAVLALGFTYQLHFKLIERYRDRALVKYCLTILLPIIAMLIPLFVVRASFNYLTIRGTPLYVVSFAGNLAALMASLVIVFGASNRIAALIIASPQINPQGLNAQLIRIASKLLSLLAEWTATILTD